MAPDVDQYRAAGPVFAEWSYYEVNCVQLESLPLTAADACLCYDDYAGTVCRCSLCESMVLACQRELEKVSSFLLMKGAESEHNIGTCEYHVQSIASLEHDEQLVRLGQVEDVIGAAMGQVLALARFRRTNFTGLWRQLCRLQSHCMTHFSELVELLAASPLFDESSLETHQLFRVSQVYAAIQRCYSGCSRPMSDMRTSPSLSLWRGWVDPARARRVHRLLRTRLSGACAADSNTCCSHFGAYVSRHGQFSSDPAASSASPLSRPSELSQGSPYLRRYASPPSPPNTHITSPAHSARSLHRCKGGKKAYSVFLDSPTLSRYHTGLAAEASSSDSFAIRWMASSSSTEINVSHDVVYGPWFADHRTASAIELSPHQLLPFLQSELNLNKLAPVESPLNRMLPLSPESDADHRSRRRELQRNAQKIQKRIIMQDLSPIVLASEERSEFVDPAIPGLRVILRSCLRFAHADNLAACTLEGDDQSWLQSLLVDGIDLLECSDVGTEHLPFDLIEVHTSGSVDSMPDWLAQLVFESTLVHPVLDFDLYLHSIATLRASHVSSLPYWMVDYCRGPFGNRPHSLSSSASSSPNTHEIIPRTNGSLGRSSSGIPPPLSIRPRPNCSCETSPLLPSPVTASRSHQRRLDSRFLLKEVRYYLSAVLGIAVVFSITVSVWPHRQQIVKILFELIDLISQWIGRLLRLPA
ncbi:hypothetical protein COEREDRAFT_81626 [Coemansia reversa NRRL 1564]|uniref:VTC domain-containing protein n=1 Tax=Coemansia reversa (strain ATCC 12441 / NRRL 1564) TaxID=763665 RepID=A0A2G5BA66_COERN|nr:hypothetical protein COEREDRAFT_81626 [Coemansia reversa NRRL 1564]|eukprot:PIA15904.1 hypothetical protein COEREDRAFT_81626 [Coemansia reversa NRRL 1564]